MAYAPIALFIYRRPDHTRRTLTSLLACREIAESPLWIFADAAKTSDVEGAVAETRRVAHALAPASATFIERDRNYGLARSIIEGTTDLVTRFGKVIVVEDDLEVSPTFLRFMNAGLERYADNDRVMQISGYQFPVELPPRPLFFSFPTSWGWATWARAWQHFDADAKGYSALAADKALRHHFDLDGSYPYFEMLERQRKGQVDSWAIRWHLSVFMRDGLVLYPGRSLVRNTGFDGGTHGGPRFAHLDDVQLDEALPDAALDDDTQRRVFAFLAEHTANEKSMRTRVSRGIQAMLGHRLVPPAVRMAGTSLVARVIGGDADRGTQDLDLYWDPKMADILDTWGTGTAWNEIQLLLANVRGKVIDIACGTGKVMMLLTSYPALEVHGFDISDFLIQKAIDRGIGRERLTVADATKTPYDDNAFDYGYSIGSLEHFTDVGIDQFLAETYRITRLASFHMIPVSRSGRDEGWLKTHQSFHNNSVEWWLAHYRKAYSTVHVLESAWHDKISVGKWFVCVKEAP